MYLSKKPLDMYSYTRALFEPSKQNPYRLTWPGSGAMRRRRRPGPREEGGPKFLVPSSLVLVGCRPWCLVKNKSPSRMEEKGCLLKPDAPPPSPPHGSRAACPAREETMGRRRTIWRRLIRRPMKLWKSARRRRCWPAAPAARAAWARAPAAWAPASLPPLAAAW